MQRKQRYGHFWSKMTCLWKWQMMVVRIHWGEREPSDLEFHAHCSWTVSWVLLLGKLITLSKMPQISCTSTRKSVKKCVLETIRFSSLNTSCLFRKWIVYILIRTEIHCQADSWNTSRFINLCITVIIMVNIAERTKILHVSIYLYFLCHRPFEAYH